jgi:hypothetical protein
MLLQIIRSDIGVAKHVEFDATRMTRGPKGVYWLSGAVFDCDSVRGCELLVGNGDCIPACDESRRICVGWESKLEQRKIHREMLARCIEPEDRERYLRGEILGYDQNGDDIPGPNWIPQDDEESE